MERARTQLEVGEKLVDGDVSGAVARLGEGTVKSLEDAPGQLSKAASERLGEAVEAAEVFKDAWDVYDSLSEYGKLVKKDDDLRYREQDVQMQLDPSAKFKLAEIGGQTYSRTGNRRVVTDGDEPKATAAEIALVERLRKGTR